MNEEEYLLLLAMGYFVNIARVRCVMSKENTDDLNMKHFGKYISLVYIDMMKDFEAMHPDWKEKYDMKKLRLKKVNRFIKKMIAGFVREWTLENM